MKTFQAGNLILTIGDRWLYESSALKMLVEVLGKGTYSYPRVKCVQVYIADIYTSWKVGVEQDTTIGHAPNWTELKGQYSIGSEI